MFKNKKLTKIKIFIIYTVLILLSSVFISCLSQLPRSNSSLEMENKKNDPLEQKRIEEQLKTQQDKEYWKTIRDYRPNVINKQN